jgi:hypothetical protein
MGFLKKIIKVFTPSAGSGGADAGYRVYVRCDACKEPLSTRINLQNDLSLTDDGDYITRKVLMGSAGCYRPVEVVLHFDGNHTLIRKEIAGGTFLTAQDYASEKGLVN